MKKTILLIFVPLISFFSLSAQISQAEADSIVKERMSGETKPYIIYAKKDLQTGFEITTVAGEVLELDYLLWMYYVHFTNEMNGKYLIAKESNGNLLEINTKNDEIPADLEEWRELVDVEYPIEISFEDFSLGGTYCKWINLDNENLIVINSTEELENYINCTEGTYPEIDFSNHTLLLASDFSTNSIYNVTKSIKALSANNYRLDLALRLDRCSTYNERWITALVTSKIDENIQIELNVIIINNDPCDCEDELYYYYYDEKLFFSEDFLNDLLLVGFDKNVPENQIIDYINQTGLFKPIDATLYLPSASDSYKTLPVNTKEQKTCSQLKEFILLLEDAPIVAFANLTFKGKFTIGFACSNIRAYTDGFLVQVYDINDINDLYDVAQETNTTVIKTIGGAGSFLLSANKSSQGNALQMANYFYETGKFKSTQPSFLYFGFWNFYSLD